MTRRTLLWLSAMAALAGVDAETALKVGARHGKPAVLVVAAGRMRADGHEFFRSTNGVWLTARVPGEYLSRLVG